MTLTFDDEERGAEQRNARLANAAETCAWWLLGEPRYLDDPLYGMTAPMKWLRSLWWGWLL